MCGILFLPGVQKGMYVKKKVTGFCPVIERDHTVFVNYINGSTFTESVFVKGKVECSLESSAMCDQEKCPLRLSAPVEITLPRS